MLTPEKMFASESKVEEADVIVPDPPSEIAVPFTVREELASIVFVTDPVSVV